MSIFKNPHDGYGKPCFTLPLAASVAVLALSGCKSTDITYVTFSPAAGTYSTAQTVTVGLPPKATNVYLTTDSVDPVADPRCAYSSDALTLDRSTLIKVGYDVAGKHYQAESLYVIENNVPDSGYTNRKVLTTWERFFVEHVLRQFSIPNENSSTVQLEDEVGGSVTIQTNILDRTTFGAPESGEQSYSFERFKMTDPDTAETVTINSGMIYGYRDPDEGNYTTLTQGAARGAGNRLEFAGTYNGWADGNFRMNAAGETVDGYYKIYCYDNGCAANPVIYALGTKNQFVEVKAYPDANTRTCSAPES